MAAEPVLVPSRRLRDFVVAIFKAAGFSDADARLEADVLVWANLRGVESHGVFRVPMYVRAIRAGNINPRPDIGIAHTAGASCVVEADRAAGPVAMAFAMEKAITLAADHAIGWALLRNTTHTGPMGYYARTAAARGMIGIASSASRPLMAYHGTRVPTVSTNPLAIAVPRADGEPLMLDMATAAIPWGKLTQARQLGTELPDNVALDDEGRVSTDPSRAALPLPLGGAKGAGLSLMIECIVSLLAGMPLIAPVLSPAIRSSEAWQHGLLIAVDIAAFTDPQTFAIHADELAEAIKAQPPAEGFDEVLMPGERGDRLLAERLRDGIPVPVNQWRALVETASELGIPPPEI